MQISVHADMKSTNGGIIRQKTPEIAQSWSNHFRNSNAIVSVKVQCETTST